MWKKLGDEPVATRQLVAVWGEPKVGKTTFALSFPDPIYYFNMDWGLDHHVGRLLTAGREVYKADYLSVSPELTPSEAEGMLKSFERDYAAALTAGKKAGGGSIVIDTTTQLWQLTSKVFLDDIKKKRRDGQIYPFDYANANAYFQNLINQVKATPMNACLIQRAREKYNAQGQATGSFEIQGNNQVPYLMGTVLHLAKTPAGDHLGTVDSCWETTAIEGVEIGNPTYTNLTTLIATMAQTT